MLGIYLLKNCMTIFLQKVQQKSTSHPSSVFSLALHFSKMHTIREFRFVHVQKQFL